MRSTLRLVPVFLATLGTALAADWPQFLGPDRNGVSAERGIARSWPKEGPKLLWEVPLGVGFGGASIAGNELYVLDRPTEDQEVLRCFEVNSGRELWSFPYDTQRVKLPHEGSRSTPSIDGDFLFTVGPVGDLYCIHRRTHKAVWNRNFLTEFNLEQTPRWGFGQSPLVWKNLVIVAPMNDEIGYLAAYDKKTGALKWKTDNLGGGSYVSPRAYRIAGVEQVLMLARISKDDQLGQLTSVDPATGKLLWKYDGYFNNIPIPFPTPLEDGRLFVTGGYGAGSVMIKITRTGRRFAISEEFRLPDDGSQIHPAFLHEGHLYANFNTNENLNKTRLHEGGLACVSLDGRVLWRTGEQPNFERGNLMFVDGLILIMEGELGELALVEPNPTGYKELARAKVFTNLKPRGNKIWAPMALSDGKLIVRSQGEMKCLDLRGGLSAAAGGE